MPPSEPEPLHPGLRLQAILRAPVHLRKIATAAAHGSLDSLRRLRKFMQGPQNDFSLPVVYANLDPAKIPSPSAIEALDENGVSDITRAFLSLLILSDLKKRKLPTGGLVAQLWPRCWAWIQFLWMHYHRWPSTDTSGVEEDRAAHFLIIDDLHYHPEGRAIVYATPGVRILLAQVWRMFVHRVQIDPTRIAGLRAVTELLAEREQLDFHSQHPPVNSPLHIAHIEELAEGAGGMDQLAVLIVDHISLFPTDPADMAQVLRGVLAFIRDTKFRGLFWPHEFRSAGIARALIEAVLAIALTEVDDLVALLDMAFDTIQWVISGNLRHLNAALRDGLLDTILTCCEANLDVPTVRDMLKHGLSDCTIHYYVLRKMRSCIPTDTRVPETSPMLKEWQSFLDLLDERGTFLDRFDSPGYKCGAIQEKTQFKRCGGCLEAYYCSESCQRADWRAGGHREACGLREHNYVGTRDRNFIRGLLQRDYIHHKHAILTSQVEFIAAHPDQPFYVLFDYTSGRPEIEIKPCVGVRGPANVQMNAYNRRQLARATQSGGRLILHRAFISFGGVSCMYWFPLRTRTAVQHEQMRQMATEVAGTEDATAIELRLEEMATIEDDTDGSVITETH
ncbi:hypothetical protein DFH06DRAFT_1291567 [Mycena polygramma]|nr:hypothetical protein DFH06DRAFT_1291567 [Mycena polygramma]